MNVSPPPYIPRHTEWRKDRVRLCRENTDSCRRRLSYTYRRHTAAESQLPVIFLFFLVILNGYSASLILNLNGLVLKSGNGYCITVTRFEDKSVEVQDQGRGIPVEYNQKEKEYNWKLTFCELYAGGKYKTNDGGSYQYFSAQTDSVFAPLSMPRNIWRRRYIQTAFAII